MAKSTDPLTLVYDEVWAYLETKSAFTTLVRASNRIKFSGGSRTPQKDKVSTFDLPEIRLIPVAMSFEDIRNSSSTSFFTQTLEFSIATGDQRLTENDMIFETQFTLIRCLVDVNAALKLLTWPTTQRFIGNVQVQGSQIGTSEADLNRGIKGWSSLVQLEIEYYFQTSDLAF